VQLESHAQPQRETPQQRYANLHRALERGLDSDEVWKELADVSLAIGHGDEAVRCMRRIKNEATRLALESRLQRLGLCEAPATAPAAAVAHAAAPAASHAGAGAHGAGGHTLRDHVVDAFQYLFHQQMPWLVLLTTLSFPLLVGVGGFLTAGSSLVLLTAIAALPGLCIVAMVGAMGREVLLASAEGNGDVPQVPSFPDLVRAARSFFTDAVLVLGALLGPSLLSLWLGAPLTMALPGLAIGAFFVPMAWGLRHLRGTLEALSPVVLVRAIARSGCDYVGVAAVTCGMFLPAALVTWISLPRPVWVQIASVGPLCVLPLFACSRLLGTWLDAKRDAIGGARRQDAPAAKAAEPARTNAAAPRAAHPAPTRQPRRPEALEHFRAPVVKRRPESQATPARPAAANPRAATPTPKAPVAKPASPKAPAPQAPAPKAPAPKAPASAPKAARPAAPASAPSRATPRAIEGRSPSARGQDPAVAAAETQGRIVVSGKDRVRQGAAARRP
jgi:hypothetical protein